MISKKEKEKLTLKEISIRYGISFQGLCEIIDNLEILRQEIDIDILKQINTECLMEILDLLEDIVDRTIYETDGEA